MSSFTLFLSLAVKSKNHMRCLVHAHLPWVRGENRQIKALTKGYDVHALMQVFLDR